ncbi:hypothetical protein FGO68_gene2322 [Halteria grandinella]|uniref:ADP-ribosylation factor n=1 Tax=Halteria grandinella TaxID=5974 RepID=A0A8J8SYX9_HALGN|nr:hypothetical protein FGO68_gene2322 [Halteria grandinella]
MGSYISSIWKRFQSVDGQHSRILLMGLDAAGKTTFLYKLIYPEEDIHTIPTIGFNVENITYHGVQFTMWDMGYNRQVDRLRRHYFPNTSGIIFIVDSADRERLETNIAELKYLIEQDDLREVPILFYANKQDVREAMVPAELIDNMGIGEICKGRKWFVQGSVVTKKEGIYEGMDWLAKTVQELRNNKA